MARSSIKPNSPQAPEASEETRLVPTTDTQVEDYSQAYDPEQYDDTSRDIEVPVLGLVNNTGPLAKQFKNKGGNFVFGDLLLGEVVDVIPIQVLKFFREKVRGGKELKYGTPEAQTAKTFLTAADAAKEGYYVDFDNVVPNRIEEAGKIGYLVIAPEGSDAGEFNLDVGSLRLGEAKCSYQRGGFRNVWRKVFDNAAKIAVAKKISTRGLSHADLFKAARPWTHAWRLTSVVRDGAENSWYEPRIARLGPLQDEVVAYINDNYGS